MSVVKKHFLDHDEDGDFKDGPVESWKVIWRGHASTPGHGSVNERHDQEGNELVLQANTDRTLEVTRTKL